MLGLVITYTAEGIIYEAGPRHAEGMVEAMGLETAKALGTPGIREHEEEGEESEPLVG